MKILFSIVTVFLFSTNLIAQSKTISKNEYERVFEFAVSETNADFPFVFEVITEEIEDGKTVRRVTKVNERQSEEYERIKQTEVADGRETNKYQIKVGFGNLFCSDDGINWKSSQYWCLGPPTIYMPRKPESVEYSVSEKSIDGKKVKVYRKYSLFASAAGSKRKGFNEEISTIDSRGFFLSVEDTEGTLNPDAVTLRMKQTWTKAKITPIVSPIK